MGRSKSISSKYSSANDLTLHVGDCLSLMATMPSRSVQLVFTSPPYNVGKEYEERQPVDAYVESQAEVIAECVRLLKPGGSICWQVGTQASRNGSVLPLDYLLYPLFAKHASLVLRNRIVWQFGHGLHCKKRFSGRHEVVLWFTKGRDYLFNLDPVRVPQKYPGKLAYKGTRRGDPSCNPIGKNPGDVWDIPNVKGNHVEKTEHPCQFPIALVENFVLATTNRRHLVFDPYLGSGTTAIAALMHSRRAAGAESEPSYEAIIRDRLGQFEEGALPYRDRHRPIHTPSPNSRLTTYPDQRSVA